MSLPRILVSLLLIGVALLLPACRQSAKPAAAGAAESASRAYRGHENDRDMRRLVAVYPAVAGTRLDDCRTCHAGREVLIRGGARLLNPCDTCHLIPFPAAEAAGAPVRFVETLNPFGLAYLREGRSEAALQALAGSDSDGDGFDNAAEIADLRYPGRAASKPGQPLAPTRVLNGAVLRTLPAHAQFLLVNSHKQRSDTYATYAGVTLEDLLLAAGVDPHGIESITVFSADGFQKDFSAEEITGRFPDGRFFAGLDEATLGPDRGFVNYPQELPPGLEDGASIPGEQRLLLAWERDGGPLDPAALEPRSGRIDGEGPFRIVVPQSRPGAPDRGSRVSPSGYDDGHDYDAARDHNAGAMVRAVVAIRVNPMPAGVEEFDAMAGGWKVLEAGELVLFGCGVNQ